jgi:DNA modification methylase
MIKLLQGDCLDLMKEIPDKSIDMILCDLPYGTTACKWDVIIPFEPLWLQYNRIIKDNGAIVLFGNEPFSSYLRLSNIKNYKYDWIWRKNNPTGIGIAKYRPMPNHENISVFCNGRHLYNKQMRECADSVKKRWFDGETSPKDAEYKKKSQHMKPISHARHYKVNPITTLDFDVPPRSKGTLHPTQKPVSLLEYFIKTYTNEGYLVLDNCMGSGSTGVACKNLNRNFIGMEKEKKYFDISVERIEGTLPKNQEEQEVKQINILDSLLEGI